MPAKSQAQRAWAFGAKGSAWAREHHFDNPGKLPGHVRRRMAAGGIIPSIFGDEWPQQPVMNMPNPQMRAPLQPALNMPNPQMSAPLQPVMNMPNPQMRSPLQPVMHLPNPRFGVPIPGYGDRPGRMGKRGFLGRGGYQGSQPLRKLAGGRPGAIPGRPGAGFNSYWMPRGFQGAAPRPR
jgi:hypothetical protein